jgi:hypothetical protein
MPRYRKIMSKIPDFPRIGHVIVVVLMLLLMQSCSRWSDREVQTTERSGKELQKALDRFRAETGVYPASLDLLTPKFLQKIPQPSVGEKRWTYKTFEEGTAYVISVETSSIDEPLLQATSTTGWMLDTK